MIKTMLIFSVTSLDTEITFNKKLMIFSVRAFALSFCFQRIYHFLSALHWVSCNNVQRLKHNWHVKQQFVTLSLQNKGSLNKCVYIKTPGNISSLLSLDLCCILTPYQSKGKRTEIKEYMPKQQLWAPAGKADATLGSTVRSKKYFQEIQITEESNE